MRTMTQERLKEVFDYVESTGSLVWRVRTGGTSVPGRQAGTFDERGYIRIGVDGGIYRAHRLIWMYVHGVWPSGEIDHLDGDKSNNRLENLRDVTRSINQQNLRNPHKRGGSGSLGVSEHRETGKWRSRIWVDGKNKSLGLYKSKDEAHAAYVTAKRELHKGSTL